MIIIIIITCLSVKSIETINKSMMLPKHTVRSQKEVRTDFMDTGAWV